MVEPKSYFPRAIEHRFIQAFALLCLGLVALTYFCTERVIEVDEMGLYNPVYMYLHTGLMTYPIHRQPDYMVVHPPLHYLVISWFMQLGLSLHYAEAIPMFLMTGLLLWLIERAKFLFSIKFGLLLGTFGGCFLLFASYSDLVYFVTLRPDLQLALTWTSGLVALESGRLDGWNWKLLFLGSFLLTFASGLHYFGAPAFLGVGVYAVWLVRDLGWGKAKNHLLALVAGACLFGIPYLVLFVIPNWQNILDMVQSVQNEGGAFQSIIRHFQAYEYWYKAFSPYQRLINLACLPILGLKIPAVFVSTIILARIPATRGIALASLPLLLFILLYSKAKSVGYYLPEFMLYLSAVAIAAIEVLRWLTQRIGTVKYQASVMLALVVAVAISFSHNWVTMMQPIFSWQPQIHETEVARAVNRELLGSNALVGGRLGLWYATGGAGWYDIGPDLLWKAKGLPNDIKAYFSTFDAIGEHYHMSNDTYNPKRQVLSSWYLDKTLNLKSFYLSGRNPVLSHLMFSAQPTASVQGYTFRRGQLHHFQQNAAGDYIFATMVCPTSAVTSIGTEFFNSWPLPSPAANVPSSQYLVSVLVRQNQYDSLTLKTTCTVRDQVAGQLTAIDASLLYRNSRRNDEFMRFYQTFEEAKVHRVRKQSDQPVYVAEEHWSEWKPISPATRVELNTNASTIKVKTTKSLEDPQLISPKIKVNPQSAYLFEVAGQLQDGGVAIHLLDETSQVVYYKRWCNARSNSAFNTQFVVNSASRKQFTIVFTNCRKLQPKRSKFEVKSLKMWQVENAQKLVMVKSSANTLL